VFRTTQESFIQRLKSVGFLIQEIVIAQMCPVGTNESSPAIHRWGQRHK